MNSSYHDLGSLAGVRRGPYSRSTSNRALALVAAMRQDRLVVHVISKHALQGFWKLYPDAEAPLTSWFKVADQAQWHHPADVQLTPAFATPAGLEHTKALVLSSTNPCHCPDRLRKPSPVPNQSLAKSAPSAPVAGAAHRMECAVSV